MTRIGLKDPTIGDPAGATSLESSPRLVGWWYGLNITQGGPDHQFICSDPGAAQPEEEHVFAESSSDAHAMRRRSRSPFSAVGRTPRGAFPDPSLQNSPTRALGRRVCVCVPREDWIGHTHQCMTSTAARDWPDGRRRSAVYGWVVPASAEASVASFAPDDDEGRDTPNRVAVLRAPNDSRSRVAEPCTTVYSTEQRSRA